MRIATIVLALVATALPLAAQPSASTTLADANKLHKSALAFVEASDARQRLQFSLDRLLEDGKQAMLRTNPGMNPDFGDEWVRRMRSRVSLDEFVNATAQVYERHFTSQELDQLALAQRAVKSGHSSPLPSDLVEKMKTESALIQHDINTQTSEIGSRLGKQIGEEIAKDHPEWVKPPSTAPSAHARKKQAALSSSPRPPRTSAN